MTLSWEVKTTPVNVSGYKPTATLVIDTRFADKAKIAELEKKLYGDSTTEPTLPDPASIITLMGAVDSEALNSESRPVSK